MTQRITYKCDICGAEFTSNNVRGFEFSGKDLVEKRIDQVHRHYCEPCIVAFVEATTKIYEAAKRRIQ
jgi:predicted RNA-binding protein